MCCFHPFPTGVSTSLQKKKVADQRRMKLFPQTINREHDDYKETHYRAHWQPLWAILGLVLCTLLVLTQGWAAVYDLCAKSKGVSKEDSIVDLVAAYLGVSCPPYTFGYSTDQVSTDILDSQHFSSSCTLLTKSYTRPKSGRTSHLGTSGSLMTCPMSRTIIPQAGRARVASEGS